MVNRGFKLAKLYISEFFIFPGARCLVFMEKMNDISARSEFTKAKVKYIAFGRTYTFNLKQRSCISEISLQNVEMVLICEGKTGTLIPVKYLMITLFITFSLQFFSKQILS